jgi:hypothetical protein
VPEFRAHGPKTPKRELATLIHNNHFSKRLIIALPTRCNPFRTLSPKPLKGKEAITTRKCRFFNALFRKRGKKSLRSILAKIGILEAYSRKWKKQNKELSPIAKRKTRQRSQVLKRKSKVTKSIYKMLCSPSRNPVKKQLYKAQIAFYKIFIKRH